MSFKNIGLTSVFLLAICFSASANFVISSAVSDGNDMNISAGTTETFNFTVTNNYTTLVNITQVNVTYGLNNFTFIAASNGTSQTSTFSNTTNLLQWDLTNKIENGTSGYFWFNATAANPSADTALNFTVLGKDDNGGNINSTTVAVQIDAEPPEITYLSPTATYVRGTQLVNVTVRDRYIGTNTATVQVYNETGAAWLAMDCAATTADAGYLDKYYCNYSGFDTHWVADGNYINVTASDAYSHTSYNATCCIADNTPPTIDFVPSTTSAGDYSQTFINANLTATDAISFKNVTAYLYNTTGLVSSNTSTSSPHFTNFTSLPDGTYYLNATAYDQAGNSNTTATTTILLDTVVPSIVVASPAANNTNSTDTTTYVEFNFTDAGSGVNLNSLQLNRTGSGGTETYSLTSGTSIKHTAIPGGYNCNVTLNATGDDHYTLLFYGQDNATNVNTTVYTITIDTAPPQPPWWDETQNVTGTATVYTNASDATSGVRFVEIKNFTSGEWLNMSLAGGSINNGNWSYAIDTTPFRDNDYNVTVNVTDWVGLESSTTIPVHIDNTAPLVGLPSADGAFNNVHDGDTVMNVTALSINATDRGTFDGTTSNGTGVETVEVFANATSVCNMTLNAGDAMFGGWSCPWDTKLLADGDYVLVANATDYAGLVGSSTPITVTVDNTWLIPSATSDTDPTYANQGITFYANYSYLGTPINNTVGNCSITVNGTYEGVMNYSAGIYNYTNASGFPSWGKVTYYVNCSNNLGYENSTSTSRTWVLFYRSWQGTVYNMSSPGQTLSGVNLALTELIPPSSPDAGASRWSQTTTTDANGNFTFVFNDTINPLGSVYQFSGNYSSGGNVTLAVPVLPPMPGPFPDQPNMTGRRIFLVPAATLNITANNNGTPVNFSGMIFDRAARMPIKIQDTSTSNLLVAVQTGRTYDITLYKDPTNATSNDFLPPESTSVTGLAVGEVRNIDMDLNYTEINVTGNMTCSGCGNLTYDGVQVFEKIGTFIPTDFAVPVPVSINSTTSNFTIQYLPKPGSGTKDLVLFLTAHNGTTGPYFGAYKGITLSSTDTSPKALSPLALTPLYGNLVNTANFGEVNTSKVGFAFKDTSGNSISGAFMGLNLTEADNDSFLFELSGQTSSVLNFPITNGSTAKASIFSPQAPPRELVFNDANFSTGNITITLPGMEFEDFNGNAFTNLSMQVLQSTDACNGISFNQSSCVLYNVPNMSMFDPMDMSIGAGINLRSTNPTTNGNFTLEFVNVDLISSGPPDSKFDSNGTDLSLGTSFSKIFKLGSFAPKIYDHVLVGLPYNESELSEAHPVSIKFKYLYGNDLTTVIWNASAGDNITTLPSGYSDFNPAFFNGTGVSCSTTNSTLNSDGSCYWNKSANMIWFTFPHFSGGAPGAEGTTVDNTPPFSVTSTFMNNTNYTGSGNWTVSLSVTAKDARSSSMTCRLYNGSTVVSGSATLANNTAGTVTSNMLNDTTYYLKPVCTDQGGNTNNTAAVYKVNVNASPTISLTSPASGGSTTDTTPTFQYTVTENSYSPTCKLYIDGSLANTQNPVTNYGSKAVSYTPTTALSLASHTWHVKCNDSANNVKTSANRTFAINAVSSANSYSDSSTVPGPTPSYGFETTYTPAETTADDFVSLIQTDENVQSALKQAGVDTTNADEVRHIAEVSAAVAQHMSIKTNVEHISSSASQLSVTITYTGEQDLEGQVVVVNVPKAFASSASDITVDAGGATVVVTQADPVFTVIFDKVAADAEKVIKFVTDSYVNRETVNAQLTAPKVVVKGIAAGVVPVPTPSPAPTVAPAATPVATPVPAPTPLPQKARFSNSYLWLVITLAVILAIVAGYLKLAKARKKKNRIRL